MTLNSACIYVEAGPCYLCIAIFRIPTPTPQSRTGAVTMLCVHETPLAKAPPGTIGCAHIAKGYVQPLADHDFRWVFLTRFLMQQVVHSKVKCLCIIFIVLLHARRP